MRRASKGIAGNGRGSRASVKAQQRRCESAPGRRDLSESGERLAQVYTPAGRPDDRCGACHLLTLDCY
jgi:hypothetical protein